MLTEKIKNLLIILLQQEVVVASWGISEIEVTPSKVSFSVSGFKFNGEVIISVTDKDNQYVINIGSQIVYCDKEQIISLLDTLIERDNNYKELLEDYLS